MPAAQTQSQEERVVAVIGGGSALHEVERSAVARAGLVVAADSGVDRGLEVGIAIDVAVGDFDSVTSAGLDALESSGARVDRFDEAKDETDLELALVAALAEAATHVVVVGLDGGRPDHALTSLLLLADDRLSGVDVTGFVGETAIAVVRAGESGRSFSGAPGDLISLVPVGGPAIGVVTGGLVYPLRSETLPPSSPRGMSNVFEVAEASVRLDAGTLLAFQPPTEAP